METGKPGEIVKTFKHDQSNSYPWNAYNAAEDWVRALGYSVGAMQSGSPTALFKGDCDISKWRNLSAQEQKECDGTITACGGGGFRDSDVQVRLQGRSTC